jgi:nucleoid-associated protein YgaU
MTAPPPGGDLAPPPGAGALAPPPADTQFKDTAKADTGSGDQVKSYSVASGDSLWRISGKSKIYGDSFQWPMIFIENRDKIKDPDIIRPGWDLNIKRGMAADEVSTAVRKAKDTPRFHPHTTERKKLPIEY